MQWLLHGSISPALVEALRRHEQVPHPISETQLAADGPPEAVFELAATKQWDLMTTDHALVNHANTGAGAFRRSIVYLNVETGDVEQDDAIDRLFDRYKRLSGGRVYTVTASRVKVRQLPGL